MTINYVTIEKILNFLDTIEGLNIARKFPNAFIRKSPLNLKNLVKFLIFKEGKTNQMELYNFFDRIGKSDLVVTKSALSEQRKKLNYEIFIKLNELLLKAGYKQKIKTLEGTNLIPVGIDGSVFEVPNIKKVKETFGHSQGTENSLKTTVARAQVSGAYDCLNNVMITSSINKYNVSEKILAMEHIIEINKTYPEIFNKILFIFDRGYIGIPLLLQLKLFEGNFLFRVPERTYKKEISQMKTCDEEIEIPITLARKKNIEEPALRLLAETLSSIKVRVVKIKLDSGETEILLTNIDKETIPTEKMKEVYYQRWNIEKSYDVIKNKLEVENFSGNTELAIQQDFYAQMFLFNIMEGIKEEANQKIKEEKEEKFKTYKYEYIININILIGVCRRYLLSMLIENNHNKKEKIKKEMMDLIKRNLVAVKTGRKNARQWRRNENNYKPNLRRN